MPKSFYIVLGSKGSYQDITAHLIHTGAHKWKVSLAELNLCEVLGLLEWSTRQRNSGFCSISSVTWICPQSGSSFSSSTHWGYSIPPWKGTFSVPPPHKIILPKEDWCFSCAVVRADCMQPGDSAKAASLEPPHHPMGGTASRTPCLRNCSKSFSLGSFVRWFRICFFQAKGLVLF